MKSRGVLSNLDRNRLFSGSRGHFRRPHAMQQAYLCLLYPHELLAYHPRVGQRKQGSELRRVFSASPRYRTLA